MDTIAVEQFPFDQQLLGGFHGSVAVGLVVVATPRVEHDGDLVDLQFLQEILHFVER